MATRILDPWVENHRRPVIRGDCLNQSRPCPWVGCRYHLYFYAAKGYKRRYPGAEPLQPWDMTQSCALDLADEGPLTLEEIAEIFFITRERVRQIEEQGIQRARLHCRLAMVDADMLGLSELDAARFDE